MTHGIVLGAGFGGMLTAAVLAKHVDTVAVLERDAMPDGPRPRKGTPQARHAHLLMSGGARVIERLLPGTIERLGAAGARRVNLPQGIVSLTQHGWQRRFPGIQYMITCSRDLLDWVIREQIRDNPRIQLLDETDVLGLHGDATRVDGVTIRGGHDEKFTLDADIIVDATGRSSPTSRWLTELGLPSAEAEIVDSGLRYASRIYRIPAGMEDFPLVSVYPDPTTPQPGRSAVLVPIEGRRWLVTISGTRGGEPPKGEDGFVEFAQNVRHPLVGRLIARAEPLGPVQGSRSTTNRRQRYGQMSSWPDRLVVLGDAAAAFNPVYGHGMSCAALSVAALDDELGRHGLRRGVARRAQLSIHNTIDDAWMLATSQDTAYPGCKVEVQDPRLTNPSTEGRHFADLVAKAALWHPIVAAAAMKVTTLSGPISGLQTPLVLTAANSTPTSEPLTAPPLSQAELAPMTNRGGLA